METLERTPLKLWEDHVGLAKSLARKRARFLRVMLGDCAEDLEQAALLALWKAAMEYDNRLGVQFSTYAWRCISNALKAERWKMSFWGFNAERAVALKRYAALPVRESTLSETEHLAMDDDVSIELLTNRDLLEFMIRQLRPVKAQIVARRHWLEGLSHATIAHQLLLSKTRIEQISAKARKDLVALGKTMWARWVGEKQEESVTC